MDRSDNLSLRLGLHSFQPILLAMSSRHCTPTTTFKRSKLS